MDTTLPLTHEASGEYVGIYTLTLEQPGKPVVVLDHALIQQLDRTLDLVPKNARALILRSASARVFVAGADLKAISELSDSQLEAYLIYGSSVFAKLGQLPCPTVAAINGAALGGGLELAMHCDFLVGAPGVKPYPIGLPEAGLKICPGWGGTNLLPARIDARTAISATATGTTMMVDDAKAAGLFDAFASTPESLIAAAMELLIQPGNERTAPRDGSPSHWIGRSNNPAPNARPSVAKSAIAAHSSLMDEFASELPKHGSISSVLKAVSDGLAANWQAALATERHELIRLRNSPEGKAAISGFLNKSK